MTEATIKELRPTSRNKIIEAKVYRSWIARNPPDVTEKDYIGCYIQSGEKEEWGNPNKDQMVLRRIEIQNLNGNSVELTLWDDLGETFPKEKIDALEKPVIIAVSSCKVTRFRNNLQLASTPATYYYIDPDIPELQQYKAEYKAAFVIKPPLQIVRHPYKDKEQEKTRNRIPLSKLLTKSPATHTDVRFTCKETITGINTSRVLTCKIHGGLASTTYRYNFKAYVSDTTDTVMMTFFSPKADDVVGINCEALVNSLPNASPREFLEKLLSIIGKTHIFQFHYNTSSKQTTVDFILDDILDKPEAPKEIKDKPSGSRTTEEACETLETTIPEDRQIPTAIEQSLPPTPSPNLIEFPTPMSPQIPMQPAATIPQVMPFEQESLLQEQDEPGKQHFKLKT
ncbi:nucleic acid-binding, OB-fold protein [Artemisia annua]|uniref:Nucleic acid-binding, OB-fold protein n=1 Tax=Artemisia annua TaxID=35608 RepID=A0A2U1KK71_ARTAN|nr:nucleic acid-binding, OB-fold protein [Artemisia annua]